MKQKMVSIEYLAGFIDGEGCLFISKKGKLYAPRIKIVNTNKRILLLIKNLMGGYISKWTPKNKRCKTIYDLEINDLNSIHDFLNKIKNHLIIKKPQAELLGRYVKSRLGRESKGYTKKEITMILKMQNLNKRGVAYRIGGGNGTNKQTGTNTRGT